MTNKGRKYWWVIGLVVLLGAVLWSRFYRLDSVPAAFSPDQMIYALNAKSLRETGQDVTGKWNWWSLTPIEPLYDELTAPLMAWAFFLPLPDNVAARLTHTIMSLLLPVAVGGLAFEVTRKKKIAWIAGILAAFNPWIWQLGRMPFDSFLGFGLTILGTWVLCRAKNWGKLASVIFFWLAFYQYQGFKVLIVFWVLAWASWLIVHKKMEKLPLMIVAAACAAQVLIYGLWQLPQQNLDRVASIVTPNSPLVEVLTTQARQKTLLTPVNVLLVNRYVIWAKYLLTQYFKTLDPLTLFVNSDRMANSLVLWDYGIFQVLDLGLMMAGAWWLMKKNQGGNLAFLLILWLVVAPIPNVIRDDNWPLFRMAFCLPSGLILAAAGGEQWLEFWRRKQWKLGQGLLVAAYALAIGYFGFNFFWRATLENANKTYVTDAVLAEYLRRVDGEHQVTVYTDKAKEIFGRYVWTAKLLETKSQQVQEAFAAEKYLMEEVQIANDCVGAEASAAGEIKIVDTRSCEGVVRQVKNGPRIAVADPNDSGEVFWILGDELCAGIEVPRYLRMTDLRQFEWSKLTDEEFCRTWLVDQDDLG